jgi:hypothetical protein
VDRDIDRTVVQARVVGNEPVEDSQHGVSDYRRLGRRPRRSHEQDATSRDEGGKANQTCIGMRGLWYNANADGLEFDHLDSATKTFNVSQFSNRRVSAVRREIEKCEVRCGTHHSVRSADQNRVRNAKRRSSRRQHEVRRSLARPSEE